ncbi:MAG: NAD(P)H-hydrate epimerase [Planctomycetota bacterium]
MTPLPGQILHSTHLMREQARALDSAAQETFGVPGEILMENAGAAAAGEAFALAKQHLKTRAIMVCGTGNNGGDGFVVARHLIHSLELDVFIIGGRERIRGDALANLKRYEAFANNAVEITNIAAFRNFGAAQNYIWVDALFGTGLDRPVSGLAAAAIEYINQSGAPVLSLDLPSGLDANTGRILGAAVRANVTITFVAKKTGFELADGPACTGRIVIAGIGVPAETLKLKN